MNVTVLLDTTAGGDILLLKFKQMFAIISTHKR